jgi:hypothetical protein
MLPMLYDSNPIAGWSSLAARRAHNPKVTGSNPVPATNNSTACSDASRFFFTGLAVGGQQAQTSSTLRQVRNGMPANQDKRK